MHSRWKSFSLIHVIILNCPLSLSSCLVLLLKISVFGNELVLVTITWLATMTWHFLPYFYIPLLMACISPWKLFLYGVILYIERAVYYACNVTLLVKSDYFQVSLLFRKEKIKVALNKSYFCIWFWNTVKYWANIYHSQHWVSVKYHQTIRNATAEYELWEGVEKLHDSDLHKQRLKIL